MKKLLVVGAVSLVAISAWRWQGSAPSSSTTDSGGSKVTFDRIWIDHLPKSEREMVRVFVALTREPIGVFQSASLWKGSYEAFRYEAHGDEIRALFPQNGDREKITATADECHDKHMDYCLELKGASRGARQYYSKKGWEVRSDATAADVQDQIAALIHDLPTE